MNLKPLLEALRRDPSSHLGRVARFLGHALPKATVSDLRHFHEDIERVVPADRSYEAGYLAAVLEISMAFEQEISQDQAVLSHLTSLTLARRNLLRELGKGPALVGELATALGRTEGAVSKLLGHLRSDGLVEITANSGDSRTRPHRLTNLGKRVYRRLPESSRRDAWDSEWPVRSEQLLEASVLATASIVQERHGPLASAKSLIQASFPDSKDSERLTKKIRNLSVRYGLLAENDRKELVSIGAVEELIARYLNQLARRGHGFESLFQEHAGDLPRDAMLWVRVSGGDVDAWKGFAQNSGTRFRSCEVLESLADLQNAKLHANCDVVLLYDGTRTAHADLKIKPKIAEMTPHSYCLATSKQKVPRPFQPLAFPTEVQLEASAMGAGLAG